MRSTSDLRFLTDCGRTCNSSTDRSLRCTLPGSGTLNKQLKALSVWKETVTEKEKVATAGKKRSTCHLAENSRREEECYPVENSRKEEECYPVENSRKEEECHPAENSRKEEEYVSSCREQQERRGVSSCREQQERGTVIL